MKKTDSFLALIAFITITGLLSGCIGLQTWSNSVTIRIDGNLTTVVAGGTLNFRATGQNIMWAVSSSSDGSQPANGTFISQTGLLSVAYNETAPVLYVTAISKKSGQYDIKQIRVVTVNAVNITPVNQTVVAGRTSQFRAQVTGDNNPDHAVTWRVSSNPAGTGVVTQGTNINANGLLTVSANETLRTLYVVATSAVDPSKYGSIPAAVAVPTVTQVTVSPSNQTVIAGSALQFTVSVTGTYEPARTVTWRVSSNTAGTGVVTPGTSINSNGVLTVARNESLQTLYIIATSTIDTTKSGRASVSVIVPTVTSVTVNPANQTLTAGGSFQFTASVAGTNNPDSSVTWRVSSNAAGTGAVTAGTSINANGRLTVSANESARVLYIFATSVFNPAATGSTFINVNPAPVVQPAPPVTTPPVVQPPVNQPTQPTPPVTNPSVTQPDPPVVTPPSNNNRPNQPGNNNSNRTNQPGNNNSNNRTNQPGNNNTNNRTNQPETTPPVTTPDPVTPPETTPPVNTTPTVTIVTVNPSTYSTRTNTTVQLSAAVTGTNNPGNAVTWRVSSNPDGTGEIAPRTTVNANGLLTVAPNEWSTTLYVTATSTVDPTKYGMAVVTISNNNSNQGSNQGR